MSDTRTEPLLRLVDDSMPPLYEGRVEVESGVMVEAPGMPAACFAIATAFCAGSWYSPPCAPQPEWAAMSSSATIFSG